MKIPCIHFQAFALAVLLSCTSQKAFKTASVNQPDLKLDEIIALITHQIELKCKCKAQVSDTTKIQYSPIFSDTQKIESEIGEDKYVKLMTNYHNTNKQKVVTHFQSNSQSSNVVSLSFSNFGVTPEKDMLMIYVGEVYGPLDGVGKIHIFEVLFENQILNLIELYAIQVWVS